MNIPEDKFLTASLEAAPWGTQAIRPTRSVLAAGVDEDFARQLNDFIEEYRPALETLAKK